MCSRKIALTDLGVSDKKTGVVVLIFEIEKMFQRRRSVPRDTVGLEHQRAVVVLVTIQLSSHQPEQCVENINREIVFMLHPLNSTNHEPKVRTVVQQICRDEVAPGLMPDVVARHQPPFC